MKCHTKLQYTVSLNLEYAKNNRFSKIENINNSFCQKI